MKKALLLTSLLIIGFNSGCTPPITVQNTTRNHQTVSQPSPAPIPVTSGSVHQLHTVQGPIITIGERSNGFIFPQYQGKVVLLQIFGKECPYCFEEMPIINNLRTKYGQRLQVVAIQAQEPMSKATASNLINKFQMHYPIIEGSNASELLFFMKETYGWNGILPYTLIIKNGVTEYSFKGKTEQQELDESIASLI